jgi:hypothetical protein
MFDAMETEIRFVLVGIFLSFVCVGMGMYSPIWYLMSIVSLLGTTPMLLVYGMARSVTID